MAGVFDFCPKYMVPRTKPPSSDVKGMSMNGWFFSAKPKVPYQKTFVVRLQGMRWYLASNGLFDVLTDRLYNARCLELFYQQNGMWDNFEFKHPHLGKMQVRFAAPVEIPEAIPNSGGLIDGFEVQLIEHNPGY